MSSLPQAFPARGEGNRRGYRVAIQKAQAVVIKTLPFRSSSLIVTFFTREFGKVRGIVKGVRGEGLNQAAVYEIFTHLEIIYYEKTRSDLHLISEAFMQDSYARLRGQLEALAYASYFCELVDEVSEVHDPHEKVFELLDFSFTYLPAISGMRMARIFEIKLLNEVGWMPYLEDCLECHKGGLTKGYFSSRQGGLLCDDCTPHHPDARPVNTEALAALRFYIENDVDACLKHQVSKAGENELEAFMGRFLMERLSRPLKTRAFLQKIKPVLAS